MTVLEDGYPTVIHGDLHPGNLRLTEQALFFVDWGYALPSLNFFDLDYVQSVALGGEADEAWWQIHPHESAAVLAAYFQACGLAHLNERQTHLAVMLWNELRNYNAALQGENERDAALCRQNITLLLQQSD